MTTDVQELRKAHREQGKLLDEAERLAGTRKRGRPALGKDHHLAAGTHRQDRHGPLVDMSKPLFPKPEHLAASKRKVPKGWIQSEADERAVAAGCWFDERFSEHFREFGRKYLRHWEGRWAGQPFELMDWQYQRVFGPLFGWFRFDEELKKPVRRHNRAYIEVPKKNGKSPMGAYCGVYMLAGDGEGGAKVFSVATSQLQAGIVHDHAINMVRSSEELVERCKINMNSKDIYYQPTLSHYRAISRDSGRQDGHNGNCCIADEIHEWPGRKLWDALRYMFATRDQPILFMITTAGTDMESICREQRDHASAVSAGSIVDQGYLPYIAAADTGDDPSLEATWEKANPSLGVTVRKSEMRESFEEAANSQALLNSFRRYRLGIWSTAQDPWLNVDDWNACAEEYTAADLEGQSCWAGLDLAKTRDLTALTLVFPNDARDEFHQLAWFWLPEKRIQELKVLVPPFVAWAEAANVILTPGNVCDYDLLREQIADILSSYDVQAIVYDGWYAEGVTQWLHAEHQHKRIKFAQNIGTFAGPTALYGRLVGAAKMHHNAQPVLTWQAGHVMVHRDPSENMRPIKQRRGDYRTIDGIVAAVMAVAQAMNEPIRRKSVYERRGVLVA